MYKSIQNKKFVKYFISIGLIIFSLDTQQAFTINEGLFLYSKIVQLLPSPQSILSGDYIKASNTEANDLFGNSVAVSGNTIVIGAPMESSNATGINGDQNNNLASQSGAVYVFIKVNGIWVQEAYLKASNSEAGDKFGTSVAIDGDIIVVSAPDEDSSATIVNGNEADNSAPNSGSVYVFARIDNQWNQIAYLKAPNTESFDNFGHSVSISNNKIVVGTPGEDSNSTGINGNLNDNSALNAGAAYTFLFDGISWNYETYIKASNTDSKDAFGMSVALSGDKLIVGSPQEASNAIGINGNEHDNSFINSGAVYVFEKNEGNWQQTAYLKASNTDPHDLFGRSLTINNNMIVIGAPGESSNATGVNGNQLNNSSDNSGASYVFETNGQQWEQTTYLKASNSESSDQFGGSMHMFANAVIIGALYESSIGTGVNGNQNNNHSIASGAGYLFVYTLDGWQQYSYLKASNTQENDFFSHSVAIANDTIVISALSEDSNAVGINGNQDNNEATSSGAVYTFEIYHPYSIFLPVLLTP